MSAQQNFARGGKAQEKHCFHGAGRQDSATVRGKIQNISGLL